MFPHPPLRVNKQIHGDDPPPSPPPIGRDRGPAAFFHGRESIRSRFNPILSESTTHNAGTIFLIQGTPRAGKTALIDVLSHQAETKGWTVVKIAVQNLYTPVSLHSLWGQRTRLIKRSTTIGWNDYFDLTKIVCRQS